MCIMFFVTYVYVYYVFCNIVPIHTHTGHTGPTMIYSFPAAFAWSFLLVETAYPIVNMFLVINKEARRT